MRSTLALAGLAALSLSVLPASFAKTPSAGKESASSIVIVFKDGHRQAFNLADIARVEFTGTGSAAGSNGAASSNVDEPARGRYVGKWLVGDGSGNTFIITLKDDGNADRSLGDIHGTWTYIDGDALVTWDDGAKDAIRKAGSKFEKYAYGEGKSFSDKPDNVTAAHNTTPHPI